MTRTLKLALSIFATSVLLTTPILAQTEEWVARYDGPSSANDGAVAVTADDQGNVYVTGWSSEVRWDGRDIATVKYDADGQQLWVAMYDGPGHGRDEPVAIAVDESGFVYVTGTTEINGHAHYVTLRYDPNGNLQWAVVYCCRSGDGAT